MFERFTDRARRVLVLAQEEARLLDHNFMGTEHILLGLLAESEGIAAHALGSLGITLEAAREQVEETIGVLGTPASAAPPFTPRAKKVLELSLRESMQLGQSFIGTEHLLLGVVREGEGVACHVLVALGADLGRVRRATIDLMSGRPEATGWPNPSHARPLGIGDDWSPPLWDRPSEGTLPAVMVIEAVVLQNDLVAVAVEELGVYPNGFTINLAMRANPRRTLELLEALGPGGRRQWPSVGVRFSDGATARAIAGADYMAGVSRNDLGFPTAPIVRTLTHGGLFQDWRSRAWVFPLPPDGPVDILVFFESPDLGESSITVDGFAIRAAAARARIIWT